MGGWEPAWKPRIEFSNEAEAVELVRANYKIDDEGFVRYFGRYRGAFYEPFDLACFPFDRQLLRLRIVSLLPLSQMVFAVYGGGYPNTMESSSLMEWSIPPSPLEVEVEPLPAEPGGLWFPRCSIACKVERKFRFHLMNIVLPSSCFVLLSMISFVCSMDNLSDRMSVVLTMLLTLVAFKFIVNDSLPKIAYFTMLDKYLLLCLLMLVLVAALETGMMWEVSHNGSDLSSMNDVVLYVLLLFWLGLHVAGSVLLWLFSNCLRPDWASLRART
eukprot:RCo053523